MKGHEYYSQFRYGNWIFCGDEYHRFKYFDGNKVYTTHGWHLPYEEVEEPIPLTPEILEKAGFVYQKLGGMSWYELNISESFITKGWKKLVFAGDYLYLQEWNGREPLDQRDIITLWNRDVMKQFYLHQLQNLYFALTQTDLPINL